MEIKEINKYAVYANDEHIRKAISFVVNNLAYLQRRVERIQANCSHVFELFFEEKDPHVYGFGKKKLMSKTCKICGYSPEKPEGPSWKICEVCW